jgi:hypothetical protein
MEDATHPSRFGADGLSSSSGLRRSGGSGLLGTLQLPCFVLEKMINDQCAFLNSMESLWTDIPQFGCWRPYKSRGDQDGLAFLSFVPPPYINLDSHTRSTLDGAEGKMGPRPDVAQFGRQADRTYS